jgi:hypothetical protein
LVDVFSGYEESPFTLNPRHEDVEHPWERDRATRRPLSKEAEKSRDE